MNVKVNDYFLVRTNRGDAVCIIDDVVRYENYDGGYSLFKVINIASGEKYTVRIDDIIERVVPIQAESPKAESVTEATEVKGVKYDSDKLQWWYMWQFLPELEQVAYVLQYGDKKYPAEDGSNWKRLDNLERRASSAAMRHLSAYLQGNKLDDETTKSHLAHCITNLLFLMYNDRTKDATS